MDALRLSIEALELPKNSEIIVPANTFVGTALAAQATGAGINTQIHYPIPIHLQTPIMLTTKKTLPVSEKFCNNVVSLPCFPYMFDKEIEYLTKIINEYKG